MRRLLTVLLLSLVAVGAVPAAARAHNVLVGSDPEDGATLAASPERVTLVFDQAVRQGYAQVGVTGADGSGWAGGSAAVAAERVSVNVRPLRAGGSYTVGYRILSADGHPVTGSISFRLAPDATGAAPGPDSDAQASAPASDAQAAAPGSGAAKAASPVGAPGSGADAADATEAAAGGGAGMAVVWIVGALVVLAAGTVVALRRSRPDEGARA